MEFAKTFKASHVAVTIATLLLPAAIFWLSVLLYVTMGTDYVFDVIVSRIGETWWGNSILVMAIIVFPEMVIVVSGMEYVLTKHKRYRNILIAGFVFMVLGFYAALRKY